MVLTSLMVPATCCVEPVWVADREGLPLFAYFMDARQVPAARLRRAGRLPVPHLGGHGHRGAEDVGHSIRGAERGQPSGLVSFGC